MKRSVANRLASKGYDLDFLRRVQNPTPILMHSDFIQFGSGYATVLSTYDYPKQAQHQGWFRPLVSQENTITAIKIGTESKAEVQKKLQESMNSALTVTNDKYKDEAAKLAAGNDFVQNRDDLNAVVNGSAVYKRIYTDQIVMAPTLDELKKRQREIMTDLMSFRMRPYTGEMATKFQQLLLPATTVASTGLRDKGYPMTAYALSGIYPFNQTYVDDPGGVFLGTTFAQGEVFFNPSYMDGVTRYTGYNLIVGNPGSGKSSVGKKLSRGIFAKGDIQWYFDSSGEYKKLVDSYYGSHITMDGSQNIINLFQIFPTALDDKTGQPHIQDSFHQHIEKIKTYYATYKNTDDALELQLLGTALTDFYILHNMWSPSPDDNPQDLRIFFTNPTDYPLMEDFVEFLDGELLNTQKYRQEDFRRLGDIKVMFKGLVEQYPQMVNGYTNIPDLRHEQVVRFDTSGLLTLEKNLFNAQYFSILSLMNAYILMNGYEQRQREKRGEFNSHNILTGTGPQPRGFWWIQDEADNIFNAAHPLGITFATRLMSQQRKNYFRTIVLFPSLSNVITENTQTDSEGARAQKAFFNLFNNKMIKRLSTDQAQLIRNVTPERDISDEQLNALSSLRREDMLLSISGYKSVFVEVSLNEVELELFQGGM